MVGKSHCSGRFWVRCAILIAASAPLGRVCLADDLTLGMATYTAGMPTSASPDPKMNQYAVKVNYFLNGKDATGGLGTATIPVPVIPATAGLPNPTPAQVAAASAAKAMAIVNAINGAKLPGVTAMVNPKTVAGPYPTPAGMGMADFTQYTLNGVRQSVKPDGGLGSPLFQTAINATTGLEVPKVNVTGEFGNGKGNFQPGGGGGGSPGSSMFQGSMMGTGSSSGSSMGLDGSGNPSYVGFGLVDNTSSTPNYDVAVLNPAAGLTDAQVLTELASLFNSDYSSIGYTATYYSADDTLAIDQLLPGVDDVWSANTDTGLFLDTNTVVPEPASISLALLGTAMLLRRQRRVM
jgi:hypothetical protein